MKALKNQLGTMDQRYFQIAFLFGLMMYGWLILKIPQLTIPYVATIFITAQAIQWLFSRAINIPYDFRSPLISSFSISILLSSPSVLIGMFAATLMVASKFLLRIEGKHIYNPANFAVIVPILLFPQVAAFVPQQWSGTAIMTSLVIVVCGLLVTHTIRRYDIAFYFLGFHIVTSLIFSGLGYVTLGALLQQFASVALLLFTFFMITDPKTIPNTKTGRLLYAFFCAGFGGVLNYIFHIQPGFVYALFIAALFLPAIDRVLVGERFEWRSKKLV